MGRLFHGRGRAGGRTVDLWHARRQGRPSGRARGRRHRLQLQRRGRAEGPHQELREADEPELPAPGQLQGRQGHGDLAPQADAGRRLARVRDDPVPDRLHDRPRQVDQPHRAQEGIHLLSDPDVPDRPDDAWLHQRIDGDAPVPAPAHECRGDEEHHPPVRDEGRGHCLLCAHQPSHHLGDLEQHQPRPAHPRGTRHALHRRSGRDHQGEERRRRRTGEPALADLQRRRGRQGPCGDAATGRRADCRLASCHQHRRLQDHPRHADELPDRRRQQEDHCGNQEAARPARRARGG